MPETTLQYRSLGRQTISWGGNMTHRFHKVFCAVLICVSSALAQHDGTSQPTIHIRDYCDPASFNAAVGPDTCVRDTSNGLITFEGFVAEIGADKSAGAWRFAPAQI